MTTSAMKKATRQTEDFVASLSLSQAELNMASDVAAIAASAAANSISCVHLSYGISAPRARELVSVSLALALKAWESMSAASEAK